MINQLLWNHSYFLARVNQSNKLFIRPALLDQLFEKKIKIRSGKKCHINFSYFLIRVNKSN
nr:hypothetical protein [Carnobacterium maltaromaticum]